MQSGGGPLQPGPSVMRGLGSGTPTSSQQQSDMQKMQSQPPLMNQQQYQQQNLFRNAGTNQNTRQPRAMVPAYHSAFIAPVFPMPYNPRMNQWANYASMPGMPPYSHQYYVPQGQFISGQHQQNRRNPGGENNLVNMPQVQMPPGQPNQQSSPMTVSHDLLVMQQLHPPPTQHTPQSGVPGAPGQAPIEQHQPNPAQVNVGAPQPQHTMMPQLQLAPHLTAPAAPPASKVNKKKQRGSRAIPIINPDTQEDLLDIIYNDSTPPTSSATPTTVASTSGPPPPLPAGAGAGNSAPPQANYSTIPPNVPQVPLNPAAVESDYDNYPPHPHQGTPELPGGMLIHHQAPPHLQHPPPNHPPPPTHVHPGQGQMFDMGRSPAGQQPHEIVYPGAGPLKPVNPPPPHLPPPPHHTMVSSVPTATAEMTTASGTPVVSANANAPSVEIKPYQQKKKKPVSEPPVIIQQPPPSVQPHPQLQLQQQQQQLHHHLHHHQQQQQQHSLPANINQPPPPTGINMVDMMPIPYGGAPERYRTISEKSIAESTLSTDAEPFVYTGASSNQPPPRVEEVPLPVPVVPVVIPEVPPPAVVLQEQQQQQQQPPHQEATVLPSKPEVVEEVASVPVPVPIQVQVQVQAKRPVDTLMAGLEKLSVEDQPAATVGHTSNNNNSKKNKQHKKRVEEAPASETISSKDPGSSKAPAIVAATTATTTTVVVEQHKQQEAVDETDRSAIVSVEEPHQQQSSSLISNLVEHNTSKLDNDNIINNNNVDCTSTTITTNNDNTTTTTDNNNVASSPMENNAKQQQLDSRQPTPPKAVDVENNVQQQQHEQQPEFDDNKNVVESSTSAVISADPLPPPQPKESTPEAVEQPTEESTPAPVAATLKAPLIPIKKSRSLTLIEYDADQWSPENPTGKKKYSRDQLMQLKNTAPAREKPINLPNSLENVLGRSSHGGGHSMGGGGNHYGKSNFAEMSLLPTFIKDRMVGGGGGGGGGGNMGQMRQPYPPKRSSQQGNQPGSQSNKQSQQGMNKTGSKIIRLQLDEEVKLNECENAWRPRYLQQTEPSDDIDRKTDVLFKKFRSVLNKLTPDNFEKLVHQVKSFVIDTDERLDGCIKLVFEKAISEPSFSEAYAKMCKEVGTIAIVASTEKRTTSFKSRLLAQCQAEFERRRNDQDSAIRDGRIKLEANKNLAKDEFEELKAQLEEEEQKVRRRAVGTVRFIGELFKHGQLTASIMHSCIKLLIEKDHKDYDEETLECLCKLLTTIGSKMEKENDQDLGKYFDKMGEIVRHKEQYRISSRIRFMIQDVIDLRRNGWNPRRQDLNPKTMNQIQKEAETEQFQNTMSYLPRGGDMGRGGRGNMQGGSKMSGSMGSGGYSQGSLGRGGNQGSMKGGRLQTDDDGFQQIPNNRNNRSQLQIDPKKINIPSNLDITARLGSAASYQGWKNNSNMFAALNNEENQAAGGGAGGGGGGGMMDRDGDRDRRDRDRGDRDRNQRDRDRDRDRERSGSHNKNSGSRDSYHKGSMERDRYNRYGSSNSQNDDRMSRSSREPSSGGMRPMSGQHSNNQMHDRDRDRGKLSSQQQQQSTIPGRGSQQRHIPQSTAPLAGKMGPPSSSGSALSKTGSGHLYQQQQLPQFAIPKDVAVRRNFPLPDEETEISLQKFSKTVNSEMDQSDIEESCTMLKDLNIKPEFYHAAVSQLFMDNVERDGKSREMVVLVIAQMLEKKVIVKADYLHALEEMFKMANDLIIDIPQLYKYVATFYVMLLNKRFINLVDVRNAAQDILPHYGATMLKELLLQYEALYGTDATVMLWYESSLNPTDFIKLGSPDMAEQYLTDAKLGYLLDSSSKALDMQTVGTQIKHFLKTNAKFMDIYIWISGYVGLERETSDEFIRTLTKAVIEHCIDDGKTKLNLQEIQKWHQILQKYIDSKPERELQALYAIQRLVVELEHPQNLLHSILEQLYELDVIMDGFPLWKDSTDPLEAAGKGVCLKGITQFMTMFMENSSDEDN
ncbi:eukaryotic translation initiation factor 4 gamma 3-like isoform X3 [Ochlerotatus camptorhynchus]|uniref:eukaryotic translation initiation factor 4 gamma 3-like isoform X3 n=1 Tax=Ochlerotatus camptorhynchus TaxID=644619 RepID=UPI0031DEC5CD